MPRINPEIRDVLLLDPFGEVFPPREPIDPLPIDGRTVALRLLRKYVCGLTFLRPGDVGGPPIRFKIPERNFEIEKAVREHDARYPSVYIAPGTKADYLTIGLTSFIYEPSRDKYAPGTALQLLAEYEENFVMEVWCSSKPERRAVLAGLEMAFSPTEQAAGFRFRMRHYFDQIVCFYFNGRGQLQDAAGEKGRWIVPLSINMRFNQVALVHVVPLTPVNNVSVDTDDNGLPVEVTESVPDER